MLPVPHHESGELNPSSTIGTLVERTTRYLVLLHLPNGHGSEHVRDALVDAVSAMPARVRRSLP